MAILPAKENSRVTREKEKLVSDHETIASIPAIAVGELIDVRVPLTIIAIDVGDRDALCRVPSVPLPVE
ncbi:MAG: hypothetical protein V4644_03750 [Patescibacteria group bacterium]